MPGNIILKVYSGCYAAKNSLHNFVAPSRENVEHNLDDFIAKYTCII